MGQGCLPYLVQALQDIGSVNRCQLGDIVVKQTQWQQVFIFAHVTSTLCMERGNRLFHSTH